MPIYLRSYEIKTLAICTICGTLKVAMSPEIKKVPARFYRSANGREPVREWLKGLDSGDRQAIGQDIATVEYGWPVGMPVCRALGAGLWEVRSTLPSHRIARVLFVFADDHLVLLHGFIKKTQATPKDQMAIARQRMREVIL
jgi:phage-related protein